MKRTDFRNAIILFSVVAAVFFYQTLFKGLLPFPGDILMSEYQPWRSSSYLGYAAGGVPNKAQYPDTVRQLYPWKELAVRQWKQGTIPFWNPYNFSGSPLLANFQSAVFYPLAICYFLLSMPWAWTVLVMAQLVLAGIFTYWYARTIGCKTEGSIMMSLSVACSNFVSVWLEYNTVGHVILWLPLMLLSIEQFASTGKRRWITVLALANTASLLAGHPQVYAYACLFAVSYAIVFGKTSRVRATLLTGIAAGIGMAGIQIVPGAELAFFAARSPHEFATLFGKILIQPWQLLMLVFPNFFGNPATRTYWPADTFVGKIAGIGIIPLFFLPSALRNASKRTVFFIASAAIVLILISANPVSWLLYRVPLPLLSASSPTLMSFLLTFSLAVLAGIGLDNWMTEPHTTKKLVMRTGQVIFLFALLFFVVKSPLSPTLIPHAGIAVRALVYGGAFVAVTLLVFVGAVLVPKLRTPLILILLVFQGMDLLLFFLRFNPFVPQAFVFPQNDVLTALSKRTDSRVWGYGTAAIPSNFATSYRYFSPEGYDPLYPRWYGELLYSYRDNKLQQTFTDTTRSDAAVVSGFGASGMNDPAKQKVLDTLSVGYILDRTENGSTEETFPASHYTQDASLHDWRIFKNLNAAPRIYLARHALTYASADEFASQLFSPAFVPGDTVLLEHLPERMPAESARGTATLTASTENSLTIAVDAASPSLLVVHDTYYPGWHAFIDGREYPILKANWTFRALAVPSGEHTVRMVYQPVSFTVGAIISMISSIALYLIVRKKRSS